MRQDSSSVFNEDAHLANGGVASSVQTAKAVSQGCEETVLQTKEACHFRCTACIQHCGVATDALTSRDFGCGSGGGAQGSDGVDLAAGAGERLDEQV